MKLQEDYCSYELSKLLKEKGFKEPCKGLTRIILSDNDKPQYKVTHQLAMKWLREVHKLHIEIDVYEGIKYAWSLSHADSGEYVIDPFKSRGKGYPTYEEAVEAALKYSLENLISTSPNCSEFPNN